MTALGAKALTAAVRASESNTSQMTGTAPSERKSPALRASGSCPPPCVRPGREEGGCAAEHTGRACEEDPHGRSFSRIGERLREIFADQRRARPFFTAARMNGRGTPALYPAQAASHRLNPCSALTEDLPSVVPFDSGMFEVSPNRGPRTARSTSPGDLFRLRWHLERSV